MNYGGSNNGNLKGTKGRNELPDREIFYPDKKLTNKFIDTAPCRCVWDSSFPAEEGETTVFYTRLICKVL